MLKLLNFKLQSQDLECKSFYRFYILQLLLFSSGLARITAIGFVLYNKSGRIILIRGINKG